MSAQSISVLKSYFETGDVPTQAQFADLIDTLFSMVATATKNQANGVAGLDGSSLVALAQLQAIIDDASNAATNKTWSITKVKGLLDTLTANISAINLILASNDINLDHVQEIVDAVKALQASALLLAGKLVDTSGRSTGKILEYDETLNSGQGGYKHVDKPTGTGSTPPTWQSKTFGTISLAAGTLAQSAFYIPATGNFAISAITSGLATGEAQSIVLKVQLSGITTLDLTLPSNVTEDGLAISGSVKEITGTINSWQLVVFERNHLGNWDVFLKGGDEEPSLTTEQIQDIVANMLPEATYDDGAGTITLPSGGGGLTTEEIQDLVGAMLPGATYDDATGIITLPAAIGDTNWRTETFGTTTNLDLQNNDDPANKFTATSGATTLSLSNVKPATAIQGTLKVAFSGITLLTITTPAGYTSRNETGVITSFPIGANDGNSVIVNYLIDGTTIEWFYPSGEKATNTTAGLTKLSVAASDPTDPIALGVNDPRVNGDTLTLTDGANVGWDGGNRADDTRGWTISGATRALNVSNFKDNGNYQAKCTLNGITTVTITLGGSGYTHKKWNKGGTGGTTISSITFSGADGSVFPLACKVIGTEVWWFVPSTPSNGTATLAAGTVTVATTRVTSNSLIQLTRKSQNGATAYGALMVGTITDGVSFVIRSESLSSPGTLVTGDTSIISYEIKESA